MDPSRCVQATHTDATVSIHQPPLDSTFGEQRGDPRCVAGAAHRQAPVGLALARRCASDAPPYALREAHTRRHDRPQPPAQWQPSCAPHGQLAHGEALTPHFAASSWRVVADGRLKRVDLCRMQIARGVPHCRE